MSRGVRLARIANTMGSMASDDRMSLMLGRMNVIFFIGVRKFQGQWLVDYWGPYSTVPVPSSNQ